MGRWSMCAAEARGPSGRPPNRSRSRKQRTEAGAATGAADTATATAIPAAAETVIVSFPDNWIAIKCCWAPGPLDETDYFPSPAAMPSGVNVSIPTNTWLCAGLGPRRLEVARLIMRSVQARSFVPVAISRYSFPKQNTKAVLAGQVLVMQLTARSEPKKIRCTVICRSKFTADNAAATWDTFSLMDRRQPICAIASMVWQ